MKNSIFIIGVFCIGIFTGKYDLIPQRILQDDISLYVLYLLIFAVGISIGYDRQTLRTLFRQKSIIFLVPAATIIGTYAGVLAVSPLIGHRSVYNCLAVGSGFGYYSLSSVLITQQKGAELGAIALISNLIREFSVLLFTPWMVRYFGKIAPICAAGVTSVDTCLPTITQYSGKEVVIIAIANGIITDISIPFLVTFFTSL